MARPRVYPDEFRERAVRLVREWRAARGLNDGGVTAISEQLGLHRETLRRWVIEEDVENGNRPGLRRDHRSRIGELEARSRARVLFARLRPEPRSICCTPFWWGRASGSPFAVYSAGVPI